MSHISVVIPVFQAEAVLEELCIRLSGTLIKISSDYEIILVDDGSTDNSWRMMKNLCLKNKHVKGLHFSRNFGQHNAITAGLEIASGDWMIIMDCDLQDRPEEISSLYKNTRKGFDIVLARRKERTDNVLKKFISRVFYTVFNFFTGERFDYTIANFGIYRRIVIDNFLRLHEQHRFFPTAISWLGFSRGYVEVTHGVNSSRKSTYNFSKLIPLGINTIISYSNKPLILFVQVGFLISILSFLSGVSIIVRYFLWKIPIQGWTSLIVSIYFIGGMSFVGMGILGLYIGKMFDEVKKRPLYIVRESINV